MTSPTYAGQAYPGQAYAGSTPNGTVDPLSQSSATTVSVSQTFSQQQALVQSSSTTVTVTQTFSNTVAGKLAQSSSTTVQVTQTFSNNLAAYTGTALSASVDPTNEPPRILVQAYNIGGPTAQVVRVNTDGSTAPVRTGDPAQISSGSWIGYDYEAPFNQPVFYRATPGNGTPVVTSPKVSLVVRQSWLVHPGVPDLSCRIVPTGPIEDDTYASESGVFNVLGRATPIVISTGRRKAATSTLSWATMTDADAEAIRQLIYDEVPLLLRLCDPAVSENVYRWVSLGDVSESREGAVFGEGSRTWSAPYRVVDRPAGSLKAQRTYQDLLVEAATYTELAARYATYRGVLTGIAST